MKKSSLEALIDSLKPLKLNNNFQVGIYRLKKHNKMLFRSVFYWEEYLDIFRQECQCYFELDYQFKSGDKDKLNKLMIDQFNKTKAVCSEGLDIKYDKAYWR